MELALKIDLKIYVYAMDAQKKMMICTFFLKK